jgi:dynein light intermediate chain 1
MENTENLWSSLLKESSKQSRKVDAFCVFLGDGGCGKSKVTDTLCKSSNGDAKENIGSDQKQEIVSFNYFDVEEGLADTIIASRVSIWSLSDNVYENLLETILEPTSTEKMVLMIGLDLSDIEDCVGSLRRWFAKIHAYFKKSAQSGSGPGSSLCNYKATVSYVQNARTGKFALFEEDEIPSSSFEDAPPENNGPDIKYNLGIPLIVIGCKADTIDLSNGAEVRRAREVQGQLRALCIQFGAGLLFTSAEKETNCAELKKYILHRLYPSLMSMELEIEDSVEKCFIPAGFDRPELISISTGLKETEINVAFDPNTYDLREDGKMNASTEDVIASNGQLESEDDWLVGLQSYIRQVDSGPSSVSAGTASAVDKKKASAPGTGEDVNAFFQNLAGPNPNKGASAKPSRKAPGKKTDTKSDADVTSFFTGLLKK